MNRGPFGARVQKVQKVQRVQRGRYRPSGDEFYNSAPRNRKPYNRTSPAGRLPSFIIMAPFIFKGVRHRCRQAAYILAAEPPPQPSALKRNGKSYNRASPAGRFPGFIIMAPFIFKGVRHRCRQAAYILAAEPPPQPSALKGLSNLRTFGAKAPSILRTLLSSEPSCFREYGFPPLSPSNLKSICL